MNRFLALVRNENIKTMKQTSYRVLFIIFAAIILVVPIIAKALSTFSLTETEEDYDWYLEAAQDYEASGDIPYALYYRAEYDWHAELSAMDVRPGSPEYVFYGEEYGSVFIANTCVQNILSGKMTTEQARDAGVFDEYVWCYYNYVSEAEEPPTEFDSPEAWGKYDQDSSDAPWEAENIRNAAAVFSVRLAELKKKISNFDLHGYYNDRKLSAADNVKEAEESLKEQQSALAADPKNPELVYGVDAATLALEGAQIAERAAVLQAAKCYEYESWEHATIECVINYAAEQLSQHAPISEELFRERYGDHETDNSYRENKQANENELKKCRDAITIGFYSLENGIPLPGTLPDGSVKSAIREQIDTIVAITSLIMIVLAGSTLSAEYSSGTIRLLLIRPRKRAKILGAKMVSMLFLWIAAILLALILSAGMDILLLGRGDTFVPDLDIAKSGAVTVTPAIVGGLKILGDTILSSAVLVSLALALSTVVRRAALSIALPIIIQTLIGIVQTVLLTLIPAIDELHFLIYTPLPYSDLSVFRTVNAAEQIIGNGSGSILSEILMNTTPQGFHPVLGALYLVAFTLLFIMLSFVNFTKQQIKN